LGQRAAKLGLDAADLQAVQVAVFLKFYRSRKVFLFFIFLFVVIRNNFKFGFFKASFQI
jgi:hypothetical protein